MCTGKLLLKRIVIVNCLANFVIEFQAHIQTKKLKTYIAEILILNVPTILQTLEQANSAFNNKVKDLLTLSFRAKPVIIYLLSSSHDYLDSMQDANQWNEMFSSCE